MQTTYVHILICENLNPPVFPWGGLRRQAGASTLLVQVGEEEARHRLVVWYDSEAAYTARLAELAVWIHEHG